MKFNVLSAAIAALLATPSFANTSNEDDSTILEPITVSADLRDISIDKIAASVSVLNELDLQDRGATHFGDVLLQLPNLNFSGQSSRPRHIQIRGMGERDEYTGAPNASVGFAFDDIDFSGIGMIGSMFDVKQVEVLRGPQSTRFGANAFAGLVNIKSNDPTPYRENMIEITGGQDDLTELGLMTSGSFDDENPDSPLYRFSLFKHDSDGAYKNATTGKDDTNGRDELSLRGKLRFTPNSDTTIDLTLIHSDLDNNYDVWALDNSFTTLSDEPGKDAQETTAGAIKVIWDGNSNYTLTSITTIAHSDMNFSYDQDWVALGHYAGDGYPNYRSTYDNKKTRKNISQEFRIVSTPQARLFDNTTDWLIGVYGSNLEEDNHTVTSTFDTLYGDYGTDYSSKYKVRRLASFGQLDHHLSDKTTISVGLRVENQDTSFKGNSESFSPNETLVGGHVSLNHELNPQHNIYASISRGYKAGGFNTELPAGADNKFLQYSKETAFNYELGLKSNFMNNTLKTAVTVFYIDRKNPQFDGYSFDPITAFNWVFFTENFDEATNYGIETEFNWQATNEWTILGSLGLLETKIDGQPLNTAFTVNGREQAHAPSYQYNLGAQYRNQTGFFGRVDITGLDSFFFDNVHDIKSSSYTVTNARIGYEQDKWEVYLWAKNLFDEKYATRGFYFGNDPEFSDIKTFTRLGDPRQIGITTRMRF
ncbi:MAG: TonB-dependent receptor [Methylococcaceae bacterium]|nr:TonB-dependent receptor [Methylococcaceae bacterium]